MPTLHAQAADQDLGRLLMLLHTESTSSAIKVTMSLLTNPQVMNVCPSMLCIMHKLHHAHDHDIEIERPFSQADDRQEVYTLSQSMACT